MIFKKYLLKLMPFNMKKNDTDNKIEITIIDHKESQKFGFKNHN